MSERKLLFLMNQEQAQEFARLLGAAERGDGDAACRLGDMYRVGAGGLRYSPRETYRWYAKSALAGDGNGQCNLGACYEHGLGCTQSYVKAVKWYRLSAAQAVGTASMNLGYCYLHGHGVAADKAEALRLFRLAVGEAGDFRRLTECQAVRPNARTLMYGQVRKRSRTAQRTGGEAKAVPEVERLEETRQAPKVWVVRGIQFTDETEAGRHIGIVGAGEAAPPVPPWEDEGIRRELLEVLKGGETDAALPSEDAAESLEGTGSRRES